MNKKTFDRWNDFQPTYTPVKKLKKIPVTTDKEMFSPSPHWTVIDSDKSKKSHFQKKK